MKTVWKVFGMLLSVMMLISMLSAGCGERKGPPAPMPNQMDPIPRTSPAPNTYEPVP